MPIIQAEAFMKLRVALLIVFLAAAACFGIHEVRASQQPAPCVVMVPMDWGQFNGISKYGLVFEDKDGTLRLIEQMPCSIDPGMVGIPYAAIEVRRT